MANNPSDFTDLSIVEDPENNITIKFNNKENLQPNGSIQISGSFNVPIKTYEETMWLGHPLNLICITLFNTAEISSKSNYIFKDTIVFSDDFPIDNNMMSGKFNFSLTEVFGALNNDIHYLFITMIDEKSNILKVQLDK